MRAPSLVALSLVALSLVACLRRRAPPARPAPDVVAADARAASPPPLDATATDGAFDAPPDVPLGPAHPLLEALREALVAAGLDRFQVDAIDLRGTAHLSDRRMAFVMVDLALRRLTPEAIDFHIARSGSYTAEVRTERLSAARPLRDPRGIAVLRARVGEVRRALDRVPEVEGDCQSEGCPEHRNLALVQCLGDVVERAGLALDAFERIETPPAPPDAGSVDATTTSDAAFDDATPEDVSPAERALLAVLDRALDAPALDDGSIDAALFDAAPSRAAADAHTDALDDAGLASPYLAVLRAIASLLGDARSNSPYGSPLSCESTAILAGLDYLRAVAAEARASPSSRARSPRTNPTP